jgi:AraC family transcriptional regulator
MSTSGGIGQFLSWDGGCLMIGRARGITPMHSHYAIQIGFGPTHGIRFRPSDQEPWTAYDGVVIASRQPHTMDATHVALNAIIFVEPERREGRALTERFGSEGISALPAELLAEVGPALFAARNEERNTAALIAAAQRVIRTLTGGVEPSVVSDERILRAVSYINSHLDAPLTLEEVAEVAFLSPSRFRHLFVEQTGTALRPYILWRRFVRVWELMQAGESLSSAAHSAGFADAAHLSRTSRRMFGFPPSMLQLTGPLPADAASGNHPVSSSVAKYPPPQPSRTVSR